MLQIAVFFYISVCNSLKTFALNMMLFVSSFARVNGMGCSHFVGSSSPPRGGVSPIAAALFDSCMCRVLYLRRCLAFPFCIMHSTRKSILCLSALRYPAFTLLICSFEAYRRIRLTIHLCRISFHCRNNRQPIIRLLLRCNILQCWNEGLIKKIIIPKSGIVPIPPPQALTIS